VETIKKMRSMKTMSGRDAVGISCLVRADFF
jgi:hypothetical protein